MDYHLGGFPSHITVHGSLQECRGEPKGVLTGPRRYVIVDTTVTSPPVPQTTGEQMPSVRSGRRPRGRRRAQKFAVRSQVWLEVDGRRVFSVGRMQLLEAIQSEGSIQKAAESLGMSYRAAWGKLKVTEEAMGISLLDRSIGGSKGGGA